MKKAILIFAVCGCLLSSVQLAMSETLIVSYFERPPYYFTDQGRATGFLVELARRILQDAGIEASFKMLPSKRIMAEIRNPNNFHCSVGWFKTREREEFAKFTLPIYQNKPFVALTTKNNKRLFGNSTTLKEIFADRSLKLGVISGFSYGCIVDRLIRDISPKIEEVTGRQKQLIKMLSRGRVSYMLIAPEEIETLIRSAGLNPDDFVSIALSDAPPGNKRYIICSKAVSDEIIDRINRSILKLIEQRSFE